MYLRLVASCAILAIASCKDVEQGQNSTDARKIFDEKREASPAVWRQIEKVTVNTTDEEVISRVVVTDLRPNKDGDASIVEGGEGNQTVTIELKSPTVLRGFEFHIEVYAVPNKDHNEGGIPAIVGEDQSKVPYGDRNINGNVQSPTSFGAASFSTKPPVPLSTDVKIDDGQRMTRSPEDGKASPAEHSAGKLPETKKHPVDVTKDTEDDDNTSSISQKSVDVSLPGLKTNEHSRHVRDTAKVSQSTTVVPSTVRPATDSKYAGGQVVNYPQWHVDKSSGNTDKLLIPGVLGHENEESKPEKDNHSTPITTSTASTVKFSDYRTDKPRVDRDTEVKTPTDQKPTTEPSDKNVQKIPTSGHIDIPKELKDIQDNKPSQDGKTPAPYVPKVPITLQAGVKSSTEKPSKTVDAGSSSQSDEDESSEEDKKPESHSTLLTAQKPKSI